MTLLMQIVFLSVTSVKSSKNVQVRKKSILHSTYWIGAFKLLDTTFNLVDTTFNLADTIAFTLLDTWFIRKK